MVKMSVLPKLIYMFNAVPVKIPAMFCRYRQVYSKIYIEKQDPRIDKTVLQKEERGKNHFT